MSHRTEHIKFQETTRNHYTQIPNIIFELLEHREISPTDFILYSTCRRIAGENGGCWVGVRGLAKRTGLNPKTITKSKQVLSKKFSMLSGKSLIEIIPGDKKSELADTIIITDIWPENDPYFQKKYTCGKRDYTPVVKETTPMYQMRPHNNEPSNKNLWNKKSNSEIVHKSKVIPDAQPVRFKAPPPPDPSTPDPAPLKPALDSTGSTLFSQKVSTDYSSPEYVELLDLETEYIKHFRHKIVARWITKFGVTQVLKNIKYYLKIHGGKDKIKNPEAWMEKALKEDFTKTDEIAQINKSFAEKAKKTASWKSLKINKRYCTELTLGIEIYYHLPHDNFKTQLEKLWTNVKMNIKK